MPAVVGAVGGLVAAAASSTVVKTAAFAAVSYGISRLFRPKPQIQKRQLQFTETDQLVEKTQNTQKPVAALTAGGSRSYGFGRFASYGLVIGRDNRQGVIYYGDDPKNNIERSYGSNYELINRINSEFRRGNTWMVNSWATRNSDYQLICFERSDASGRGALYRMHQRNLIPYRFWLMDCAFLSSLRPIQNKNPALIKNYSFLSAWRSYVNPLTLNQRRRLPRLPSHRNIIRYICSRLWNAPGISVREYLTEVFAEKSTITDSSGIKSNVLQRYSSPTLWPQRLVGATSPRRKRREIIFDKGSEWKERKQVFVSTLVPPKALYGRGVRFPQTDLEGGFDPTHTTIEPIENEKYLLTEEKVAYENGILENQDNTAWRSLWHSDFPSGQIFSHENPLQKILQIADDGLLTCVESSYGQLKLISQTFSNANPGAVENVIFYLKFTADKFTNFAVSFELPKSGKEIKGVKYTYASCTKPGQKLSGSVGESPFKKVEFPFTIDEVIAKAKANALLKQLGRNKILTITTFQGVDDFSLWTRDFNNNHRLDDRDPETSIVDFTGYLIKIDSPKNAAGIYKIEEVKFNLDTFQWTLKCRTIEDVDPTANYVNVDAALPAPELRRRRPAPGLTWSNDFYVNKPVVDGKQMAITGLKAEFEQQGIEKHFYFSGTTFDFNLLDVDPNIVPGELVTIKLTWISPFADSAESKEFEVQVIVGQGRKWSDRAPWGRGTWRSG